jgi:protein-tyrosine phosphatase
MGPMDSAAPPMSPSQNKKEIYSLCFICFGNICRSPALAAVLESLAKKRGAADRFFIDSMALTTYYLGKQADPRMRKAAEKNQIEIDHIAQLFKPSDFQRFDVLFGVTDECIDILKELSSTEEERKKIMLATAFAKKYKNKEIPDPYYDSTEAFDHVMEMAFDACEGILDHFLKVK